MLLITMLMMLVLSGLAIAAATFSQNSMSLAKSQLLDKQAFYIAEAGWQRGRQAVSAGTWTAATSPGNVYTETFGVGEYRVTVVDEGSGEYSITSEGYVPSQTSAVAKRKVVEDQASATVVNTNLSLAATASASSSNSSHTASKANDGSTGTYWQSGNNGSGSWLAMDYSSSTTVNRIIIQENSNITGISSVDWSNDGSSWSAVSGLSVVESPSQTWTADFTSSSHRYFRAVFNAASSKKPSVEEMESYNTANQTVTLGRGDVTTQW